MYYAHRIVHNVLIIIHSHCSLIYFHPRLSSIVFFSWYLNWTLLISSWLRSASINPSSAKAFPPMWLMVVNSRTRYGKLKVVVYCHLHGIVLHKVPLVFIIICTSLHEFFVHILKLLYRSIFLIIYMQTQTLLYTWQYGQGAKGDEYLINNGSGELRYAGGGVTAAVGPNKVRIRLGRMLSFVSHHDASSTFICYSLLSSFFNCNTMLQLQFAKYEMVSQNVRKIPNQDYQCTRHERPTILHVQFVL